MTEKIAWYKEILELEPSSKIFFPLARLLHRDGHTEDAIELLCTGLSYHKDFFEARLMLIELLHHTGASKQCDVEVRTLLASFTAYPQFWNAWEACLRHDGVQNDVSLAMRFIAASQTCSDISFASLLDKGLQSLEKQSTNQSVTNSSDKHTTAFSSISLSHSSTITKNSPIFPTKLVAPYSEAAPFAAFSESEASIKTSENFEAFAAIKDNDSIEKSSTMLRKSTSPATHMDFTDYASLGVEHHNEQNSMEADIILYSCEPVQAMDYADFLLQQRHEEPRKDETLQVVMHPFSSETPINKEPAAKVASNESVKSTSLTTLSSLDDNDQAKQEIQSKYIEENFMTLLSSQDIQGDALTHSPLSPSYSLDNDIPLPEITTFKDDFCCDIGEDYHDTIESLQSISLYNTQNKRDTAPKNELFTLRTRSMAEVLLAQGDIQGALAIYNELLLTEKSEESRCEIQERVDVLRQNKACFDVVDGLDEPCHGKEKLLQMLTLLAERLDSRAQQ